MEGGGEGFEFVYFLQHTDVVHGRDQNAQAKAIIVCNDMWKLHVVLSVGIISFKYLDASCPLFLCQFLADSLAALL